MKYVIIDKEEVQHVNWLQVCETNEDSLRYNINADKTFVKFNGDTPSFLEGKTILTKEEILAILNNPSNGWVEEEE